MTKRLTYAICISTAMTPACGTDEVSGPLKERDNVEMVDPGCGRVCSLPAFCQ